MSSEERRAAVQRLERLSRLLDSSFRIPGTRIRTGLDPLIGLIPGVGDLAGAALSTYLVAEAARLGIPRRTLARMMTNVGIETIVGAIPILGDLFDVAFRANRRNVKLLENALRRQESEEGHRLADAPKKPHHAA